MNKKQRSDMKAFMDRAALLKMQHEFESLVLGFQQKELAEYNKNFVWWKLLFNWLGRILCGGGTV